MTSYLSKIDKLTMLSLSQVEYRAVDYHDTDRRVQGTSKNTHRRRGFSWGRWVRGALGYALRDVSCTGMCGALTPNDLPTTKTCVEPSCAYARGFLGLGTSEDSPAAYRLSPSTDPSKIEHFRLTLFGALAEDHLLWIWGVQRALRRGLGKDQTPYLLCKATDTLSAEMIWDLDGMTFPVLPSVMTLAEAVKLTCREASPRGASRLL